MSEKNHDNLTETLADTMVQQVDAALRALNGLTRASRPNPAQTLPDDELSELEKKQAGRLMRVNHCGEICAQALYLGQGLTSNNQDTALEMEKAALEEADHLAWCESRLKELDTSTSRLNPIFYGLSFAAGAASGLIGNRFNLGFVAATEEQVVKHLDSHLQELPANDHRSRKILSAMKQDEDEHRTGALKAGGADFPRPAKKLMTLASRVMTRSTYWL